MAALRLLAFLALAVVVASRWPETAWPAEPLTKGETLGAQHASAQPQMLHARRELSVSAPDYDETALVHIIGWSSLLMVIAMFFATMSMCNMDAENDSLLYSKAKAD